MGGTNFIPSRGGQSKERGGRPAGSMPTRMLPNKENPMQAFRGKAPKYIVAGLSFLMLLGAAAPMLRNILG